MNVFEGQRTVSPRTPAHSSAARAAPVQPLNPTASRPFQRAHASSNSTVSVPSLQRSASKIRSQSSCSRARSRWSKPIANRARSVVTSEPSIAQAYSGRGRAMLTLDWPRERAGARSARAAGDRRAPRGGCRNRVRRGCGARARAVGGRARGRGPARADRRGGRAPAGRRRAVARRYRRRPRRGRARRPGRDALAGGAPDGRSHGSGRARGATPARRGGRRRAASARSARAAAGVARVDRRLRSSARSRRTDPICGTPPRRCFAGSAPRCGTAARACARSSRGSHARTPSARRCRSRFSPSAAVARFWRSAPPERAKVPGIVHDASSSGQTLFVEPFGVVELSNRISEAAAAAREEADRILAELSGQRRRAGCVADAARRVDRRRRPRARGRHALAAVAWQRGRRWPTRCGCSAPGTRCSSRARPCRSTSTSATCARS